MTRVFGGVEMYQLDALEEFLRVRLAEDYEAAPTDDARGRVRAVGAMFERLVRELEEQDSQLAEDALELLALMYEAHPDYRPEWRP